MGAVVWVVTFVLAFVWMELHWGTGRGGVPLSEPLERWLNRRKRGGLGWTPRTDPVPLDELEERIAHRKLRGLGEWRLLRDLGVETPVVLPPIDRTWQEEDRKAVARGTALSAQQAMDRQFAEEAARRNYPLRYAPAPVRFQGFGYAQYQDMKRMAQMPPRYRGRAQKPEAFVIDANTPLAQSGDDPTPQMLDLVPVRDQEHIHDLVQAGAISDDEARRLIHQMYHSLTTPNHRIMS